MVNWKQADTEIDEEKGMLEVEIEKGMEKTVILQG